MKNNYKILIADDSAFMRQVLIDCLKVEGYNNFVECENGLQCIEKFESEKPDLVLLDLIMPEMDGIEVLKKIGSKAKIIVISAIGQNKMIDDAKKYGAKGFIIKPFDQAKINEEINKILN